MTKYRDLYTLSEDERITQIGDAAMLGQRVAFLTDSYPGKAERYIAKLRKRFPALRVDSQTPGPTPGVVTVVVVKADA